MDFQGNVVLQDSFRASASLKTTLSGRSSSRKSPSFRRLGSVRTPRRNPKGGAFGGLRLILGNRLVHWLILIALWAYIGFYVQSKWAHNDNRKAGFVGHRSRKSEDETEIASKINGTNSSMEGTKKDPDLNKFSVSLAVKGKSVVKPRKTEVKNVDIESAIANSGSRPDAEDGSMPWRNATFSSIFGPFAMEEERVLEWSPDKRKGTCDRGGEFARIVRSRAFVLVFHELSMTGAPLSMMELATEILSCGGTVSVVVLSRKGGLMVELVSRGIKVLKDKTELSYKAAKKADLVIAGSAVCSSWIGKYLIRFPTRSNKIAWWIMENRREYFNRSKLMLNRVEMLMFLSESQSKQWLAWCEEEKIQLNSKPAVVPLSVNEELAFAAGLPCSLNSPAFSVQKMLEKKDLLREMIRKDMGLHDDDMLVMSLSSINPGKGQRLLLESALLIALNNISTEDLEISNLIQRKLAEIYLRNYSTLDSQFKLGLLHVKTNQIADMTEPFGSRNSTSMTSEKKKKKKPGFVNFLGMDNQTKTETKRAIMLRRLLLETDGSHNETLKILIGSVGSKSNKALYVSEIMRFLSQHSTLSSMVLWTPATTHVASLYAAADIYIINAQGLGETFGRVTIEAMAFGLPVLGTDAGGTKEIVVHGVTGLLHPIGRGEGTKALARHIQYLLKNPSVRKELGMNGKLRAQSMYLKHHTYNEFAKALLKCFKPR